MKTNPSIFEEECPGARGEFHDFWGHIHCSKCGKELGRKELIVVEKKQRTFDMKDAIESIEVVGGGKLPESMKHLLPFNCLRCGDCCIWAHLPLHPSVLKDPRFEEWATVRGAELTKEMATFTDAMTGDKTLEEICFITLRLPCPNLVYGIDNKATCVLHNTRKPQACKDYRCDRDPIFLRMKGGVWRDE